MELEVLIMGKLKRKAFKVVTRFMSDLSVDMVAITEVLGYFKVLQAEAVFIYYNKNDCKWYVIDPLTGLAITSGRSMYAAETQFSLNIETFINYRNFYKYQDHIKKYNELLKESSVKMDFDKNKLLSIYDSIENKRKQRDEHIETVTKLDKEIQFEILEYRIASVKRVLEYFLGLDSDFDKLVTHCINKLEGNIDGVELNLNEERC